MSILPQKLWGLPVIIGSGLAGLSTALHLNRKCVLLSYDKLGEGTASELAQGGIAAAIGSHDSYDLHIKDTINAGAGLSDKNIVKHIIEAGEWAIRDMEKQGVSFFQSSGEYDFHMEAAHSKNRILHCMDKSGWHITQALVNKVKEKENIIILENTSFLGLSVEDGRIKGIKTSKGFIPTSICVLATGGVGGLYSGSTTPEKLTGNALALAARAGVSLIDMEFTQFHPTLLNINYNHKRRALISEAVRGAGAYLVDENGDRFTDELKSRDIVARAIFSHIEKGHKVYLDVSHFNRPFQSLFPGITDICHKNNIFPEYENIPISPGMHYHMGGIDVDINGRSNIDGLWACGEVACTGLHGANRLASNSLLEAYVGGRDVANDINSLIEKTVLLSKEPVLELFSGKTEGLSNFMNKYVGIMREEKKLKEILNYFLQYANHNNDALIAAFITKAALNRKESRGAHWRKDYSYLGQPIRQSLNIYNLV